MEGFDLILKFLKEVEVLKNELSEIKNYQIEIIDRHDNQLVSIEVIQKIVCPKNRRCVSLKTIRRWFASGLITNRNPGGRPLCTIRDLKKFLKETPQDKYKIDLEKIK